MSKEAIIEGSYLEYSGELGGGTTLRKVRRGIYLEPSEEVGGVLP